MALNTIPPRRRVYLGCIPPAMLAAVVALSLFRGTPHHYAEAFMIGLPSSTRSVGQRSSKVCARQHSAAALASRVSMPRRSCLWGGASSTVQVREAPTKVGVVGAGGGFNEAEIVEHLEHDYRADLALLATKFGTMIERVEDIEEVHVTELDGDHMSLSVIYCDHGEQTCVAVAVPIKFPYHCDDEDCIIHAIHDLEEMEDVEVDDEIKLPKRKISPELMETIARITVVMNRDFQEELVSFVRAFGGPSSNRPTGEAEMISLSPDGFSVQCAMFPDDPVSVSFSQECMCAADFQKQILALSEQAMSMARP